MWVPLGGVWRGVWSDVVSGVNTDGFFSNSVRLTGVMMIWKFEATLEAMAEIPPMMGAPRMWTFRRRFVKRFLRQVQFNTLQFERPLHISLHFVPGAC